MWFRHLTASAACAALVGLAASGLVRTHFSEVMSALARNTSEKSPSDEPIQADGSSPSVVELTPEDLTSETSPTSAFLQHATKGHQATPTRTASSHNPVHDTFSQELDRGIRKVAERRFEIKRSTLELALGNLGLLTRWARVMPDTRAGEPSGFRLVAVRVDGPFAKLGLRNDDVLVSINGLDIRTPERVLDAYSKLKTAPHLVLGLIRDRREVAQEYTIR